MGWSFIYFGVKEIVPNKAAKSRKRLRKKLTIENKRRKRGIIKARKIARKEREESEDRDV